MPYINEQSIKSFVTHYQQMVFALVLYLMGGDEDKAYEVATSSFSEAIKASPFLEKEETFLIKVIGIAIAKSRELKTIPTLVKAAILNIPVEEKESLHIVQEALQVLSFEAKVLVLLRDQLHLPYKEMSAILRISEKSARIQTNQARLQLREKIEEVLSRGG